MKEFEDATDRLESRFDDDKDGGRGRAQRADARGRLDGMMGRFAFTDRAQSDWRLLRNDLDELARAYGVAWEWTVATAAPR